MTRRTLSALVGLGLAALASGCVERRFRIESNPPGAYAYVNNVPYGPTPVDVPFVFYGGYDIQLVKDGYQTKTVHEYISAPWYQYPPIDFFSESLYPGQITDIRPLYYELEPYHQPNLDVLKAEAEELRKRGADLPPPRYPPEKKDGPAPKKDGAPNGSALPPAKEQALPPPRPVSPYPVVKPPEPPK